MTLPKEVKERALQLASEGNSAEKVANILNREFPNDYPCSRTVRKWIEKGWQKKEEDSSENIERKRYHDIEIFKRSDALINERGLLAFLWPMDGGPPIYYYEKAEKVGRFLDFFRYEGHRYIDTKLRDLCSELCNALRELGIFLYDEFRSPHLIDHGDEKYARLIPSELSYVYYHGDADMESDPRYWEYFNKLQELRQNVESCLKQYRAYIRENLFQ